MRLIILGGAGAGKGTQAQRLSSCLSIPWISTGNILRDAVATGTKLGKQAQTFVEKGELVPDEIMIEFMRQRLLLSDVVPGWVIDGYPRTAFQAEELDFLLADLGQQLDWAIWLDVPESELEVRCLTRGLIDDQPEIIQRRIQLFQERTIPILDYYGYRQRLLLIDGVLTPEQVEQSILKKISQTAVS
ncbi:adenylate kinase [[Phormidium ambiguum] IAM M-71]|uniref:Adenylate kinase n=1 Tax=[Phormidium ambiguum] IAM M-71 TaxID=454136 RepID=A0A1U7IRU0_9CYAN|nr:adenylate kinase [Phormidium ambiguum]OKH40157.1 adenylate kinase [Phormidium ambiguum IAM M-71]